MRNQYKGEREVHFNPLISPPLLPMPLTHTVWVAIQRFPDNIPTSDEVPPPPPSKRKIRSPLSLMAGIHSIMREVESSGQREGGASLAPASPK